MDRAGARPRLVYDGSTAAAARPRAGVSLGIWVPIVWYALETSSSVSRWLSMLGYSVAPATDYMEGSPLDRAVYSCLLALGLMILMSRRIKWGEILKKNAWLAGLFVYMLA